MFIKYGPGAILCNHGPLRVEGDGGASSPGEISLAYNINICLLCHINIFCIFSICPLCHLDMPPFIIKER
jgi:hypothetical protein